MLNLTEPARQKLSEAMTSGELESGRLRIFIDHRCHCGKAHFSLAREGEPSPDDTVFDVGGIPFVADADTAPELPSVEIDFVETVWTKGFTIRNVDHQCGPHMMDR
ncbi:MAG: iron-sulfur cluster biosynthesis family protein [Dehalococcoidia bacterium]